MSSVKTLGKLFSLVLALLILPAAGCMGNRAAPVALPPPAVLVALPIEREVEDYQIYTARTQAVESVNLKARVTGYLTKINFKDGDMVTKDQVLFVIDKRPYKATQDMAKADLEYAEATTVKNKAEYDIGLKVQKQDPGAISQQELTKRKGNWEQAKASIDKAKASLESADLNYGWCEVISPITGRVDRHLVDIGNIVSTDTTTLTNIVSLQPVWAYFYPDENTVERMQMLVRENKIKSARKTEVPVQMGLGISKGYPINGHIDFLANQLDPNTGSLQVRAVFPNKDGVLAAGQFGRIRVPTGPLHDALLVNDRAIGTNQGQRFILVVNDKDEAEYRPVTVGQEWDGLREVQRYRTLTETAPDGTQSTRQVEVLKPTDRVIVEGLMRVRPGSKVKPSEPPVNMQSLVVEPKGEDPPKKDPPKKDPAPKTQTSPQTQKSPQ
jgi:RND family efflux transporter MFP subunit